MKSMANTSLSFGLVNVPVKLYKATESHGVEFHQHHGGGCGGQVGYGVRTCKVCAKEVEWADIVKGHDTDDGGVVIVTSDELADIRDDTTPGIEVLQFVHADEIPPMILEAPHYLEPNLKASKGALQGYLLLRQVLEESQRVGVVRYVLRDTAHIGVLRVEGKALVVQGMCWADELRPAEFAVLDKEVELDPKAVKMAHGLIESMLGSFVHSEYTDGYAERVRELVANKAAGVIPAPADRGDNDGTADVSDLLAALTASVTAREDKATAKSRHPASGRRSRKTA